MPTTNDYKEAAKHFRNAADEIQEAERLLDHDFYGFYAQLIDEADILDGEGDKGGSCNIKTWYIEMILSPRKFMDIYIRSSSHPSHNENSLGERLYSGTMKELIDNLKRDADAQETGDDDEAWESDEYDSWIDAHVENKYDLEQILELIKHDSRFNSWNWL